EIDTMRHEVRLSDRLIPLTAKEFDLLLFMAHNPGRVYSRAQLLDAVWGTTLESYEHNVNTHINRLRAKVETDPANPQYVLTVRGVGYRFADC
ncbi:MAG: winged helix-turn-helix domain-containing protein, partial [Sulfuriferula sp.]